MPDYGGAAASTGLAPNDRGRNPGRVPVWIPWQDVDDEDDKIEFELIYGPVDNVMVYAVTYLTVLDDVTVRLAARSDDSIHILLDGETIHANNVIRTTREKAYQDILPPIELTKGRHTLMVKVFEGRFSHNFALGFLDDDGNPLPGGPEEIEISLDPGPILFQRGDANADGSRNIADPVFILNHLFGGGPAPLCRQSADANDDNAIDIADPVYELNHLFGGGPALPPPVGECGVDPTPAGDAADDLGCEALGPCGG